MTKRIRESGKWFSWLLWPELRFAGGVRVISSIDTVCGWLLIVPLAVTGVGGIRANGCGWAWDLLRRRLVLNWPNPNVRYLVPIRRF